MTSILKGLIIVALILQCSTTSTTKNKTTSWRPTYHVAPLQGWMNDPNGLSYYGGYYHAFWQYNPDAPVWGLMHWGHARSKDMLTWEHLAIALTPSLPDDIDGIFSGSAVVKDGNLTVIYTGQNEQTKPTQQREMVAVSSNGVDFEKLGVVLVKDGDEENFRDPKAWWQNGSWFVVIGYKTPEEHGATLLYKSQNFINWTYEGVLAQSNGTWGYMWECPDFFTLGDKQILIISPQGIEPNGYDYQNLYQTGYFVGSWTPGSNYSIEKGFREIDHGHDFYATQSFLAPDGRRILIGWLGMWESEFPENRNGWAAMLTLPRELTISKSGDLQIRPIREIKNLRVQRTLSNDLEILANNTLSSHRTGAIFSSEILVDFDLNVTTSKIWGVELAAEQYATPFEGVRVYVNRSESRLFLERYYPQYNIQLSTRSVPIDLTLPVLSLDIFVDGSSIEVFVNDGQAVLSSRIYPNDDQRIFGIFTEGDEGSLRVLKCSVWDI